MRRAIVTGTATVSGVVLLLGLKPHNDTPSAAKSTFSISSSGVQAPSQSSPNQSAPNQDTQSQDTQSQSSGAPSSAPSSSSPAGSTAAKTVTGDAADTRYGPVQVAVTFDGKKITKIDVLEY